MKSWPMVPLYAQCGHIRHLFYTNRNKRYAIMTVRIKMSPLGAGTYQKKSLLRLSRSRRACSLASSSIRGEVWEAVVTVTTLVLVLFWFCLTGVTLFRTGVMRGGGSTSSLSLGSKAGLVAVSVPCSCVLRRRLAGVALVTKESSKSLSSPVGL